MDKANSAKQSFFNQLHLQPHWDSTSADRSHPSAKRDRMVLKIDLTRAHSPDCMNRGQLTPCSMLSPLTPKIRNPAHPLDEINYSEKFSEDFQKQGERDPSNYLAVIDLTSPLGRRTVGTVARIVRDMHLALCYNYNDFCNRLEQDVDNNSRYLRSFYGRKLLHQCKIFYQQFLLIIRPKILLQVWHTPIVRS